MVPSAGAKAQENRTRREHLAIQSAALAALAPTMVINHILGEFITIACDPENIRRLPVSIVLGRSLQNSDDNSVHVKGRS